MIYVWKCTVDTTNAVGNAFLSSRVGYSECDRGVVYVAAETAEGAAAIVGARCRIIERTGIFHGGPPEPCPCCGKPKVRWCLEHGISISSYPNPTRSETSAGGGA